MADCSKCKNCYFVGGFMECKKDLWSNDIDEPCEKYDEYTSEDAYWDKYEADEKRWKARESEDT